MILIGQKHRNVSLSSPYMCICSYDYVSEISVLLYKYIKNKPLEANYDMKSYENKTPQIVISFVLSFTHLHPSIIT